VLLAVNFLILLLPLAGIGVLRLYENELVRRTESELISQGVMIAASYGDEVSRLLARQGSSTNDYGHAVAPPWRRALQPPAPYHPIPPRLDIAIDPLLPPAPMATVPPKVADPIALRAAQRVLPLLATAKEVTLVGIRVVDGNGVVVASTGGEEGLSLAEREEVVRALSGEQVSLLRQRLSSDPIPSAASVSRGKRVRVFVALPVVANDRVLGAVILSRTPLDIGKALYLIRHHLYVIAVGLLVVVLLVTLFTTLAIRRPLQALIQQAERVVRGERGAATPLTRPGTKEIAQLSQAVADMAQSLEERADYIRTFATSVSHEFKTPLTAIRGSVELLQDHLAEMSGNEQQRFLALIDQDAQRLQRLVNRLLELARAEVVVPTQEELHLAPLLERIVARFRDDGLAIDLQLPVELPRLSLSVETVETVLVNLLDNARQHGGPQVRVVITGSWKEVEGAPFFQLTVCDTGTGISAGNRQRLFRPFFTTARDRGGSGLGLAIVKKLLEVQGGSIELAESATGACFVIQLPVGKQHMLERRGELKA
jgi:signal transduction histidine kinase